MARTPFAALAEAFTKMEATTSGQKMIDILADLFARLSPEEARMAAYLLRGRVAPDFVPVEFGVADKLAIRALAEAAGVPTSKIQEAFRQTGDLGEVAAALAGSKVRRVGLPLADVFGRLKEIALASGPGAQQTKVRLLADLLRRCPGREANPDFSQVNRC